MLIGTREQQGAFELTQDRARQSPCARGIGGMSLLLLLVTGGFPGANAQSSSTPTGTSVVETDVTKIKQALLGNWESIAPEIRPSKNPDGSAQAVLLEACVQISAVGSLRA
jgi:hypothetical protein